MQKGYLLPLSSIAAGAVDAHGGAKPELPAIRVPPSPPVDTRLGFVSIATTSNRRRQPPRFAATAHAWFAAERDGVRVWSEGRGEKKGRWHGRAAEKGEEGERRTGTIEKNSGVLPYPLVQGHYGPIPKYGACR